MTTLTRRALLGGVCGGALAAPARKPPNIVFILADDLGWMDTACYGSRLYETPSIDRLAREGMRFTDAYDAAPLCRPTRASIMTGKFPSRFFGNLGKPQGRVQPEHRYVSLSQVDNLPLEEVTLAKALKPAGYTSGYVGKWHLGNPGYYPEQQGFDVNIGQFAGGMVAGFFYPDWKGKKDGVRVEGKPGDYLTDRLTDEALNFMENNQSRPFFLYLSHFAVHTPIQAKPHLIEKYKQKIKPGDAQHHPIYAAMIESMDESVGRIMKKLDALRLADRTVVIFTSDNGGAHNVQTYTKDPLPPTSNLPLRSGKATLFEGGIRVPLIVRWPGAVKPGAECSVPVISNDYLATLAEIAGVKPHPTDGESLVPLLMGKGKPKRDDLYWYYPFYDWDPMAAVRRGNHKLIEFLADGHVELYDLAKDIGETKDLAPAMPKLTQELRGMLEAWKKRTGAVPMPPNPGYKPPE